MTLHSRSLQKRCAIEFPTVSGEAGVGVGIEGAPSIQGVPPETVHVGDDLTFEPRASDPDGDSLTFSIESKPVWAKFDKKSGTPEGKPGQGDIDAYPNIRIIATDGENTASVGFTIEVAAEGDASVSLTWVPPTEHEDGTPLTNLAGYYIYYGIEEGEYDEVIEIDDPSISTYVVDKLLPGTYYFVVRSYAKGDVLSRESNVAVKVAM